MSKKCNQKLKELIQEVVLPDIEDYLDEIFEQIAKKKTADEEQEEELANMHEMREEFQGILEDIEDNQLDNDECVELLEEITLMIKEKEDEEDEEE